MAAFFSNPPPLFSLSLPISTHPPFFASISSSSPPPPSLPRRPGKYREMLDQFFWECEADPDHRHTPEVERILTDDPLVEKRDDLTPEKLEENRQWWEAFEASPVVKFLRRAEVITDKMNEMELKANENPYRKEDRELWRKLPHVPGLDGRPMPRKTIKGRRESDDKFWDFARQFFFGLWGFRQRPYPPGRPIDVAQAIGYERLEKRYYDCE